MITNVWVKVLARAPYVVFLCGSVWLQYTAGREHTAWTGFAVLAVAACLETVGAWIGWLALQQARHGQRPLLFGSMAALFAAIAITINIAGHAGDLWAMGAGGVLSAAVATAFFAELRSAYLYYWDPAGEIRRTLPPRSLLQRLGASPAEADLALSLALGARLAGERMSAVDALHSARTDLEAQREQAAVLPVLDHLWREEGLSGIQRRFLTLRYGGGKLGGAVIASDADRQAMAAAIVSRYDVKRPITVSAEVSQRPSKVSQLGNAGTPKVRPSRDSNVAELSRDTASLERLDEVYARIVRDRGTPPSARELGQLAGVSKSSAGRWLRAKQEGQLSHGDG